MCTLTSKAHILMDMYHSSLIGGHTGITKCYQTTCRRFYCPNLVEQLRAYITGCHTCQMFKKGKNFQRPYLRHINLNIPAMRCISMDMKQMPPMGTHISWCYYVKYLIIWWHYLFILPEFNIFWKFYKEVIWHTLDPQHTLSVIRILHSHHL